MKLHYSDSGPLRPAFEKEVLTIQHSGFKRVQRRTPTYTGSPVWNRASTP